MRVSAALVIWCWLWLPHAHAADLTPETAAAFDKYIRDTEARLAPRADSGNFLWVDEDSQRLARVRAGEVVIVNRNQRGPMPVAQGLIHDWIGAVFVPDTTLGKTLAFVQDYDHHAPFYKPEMLACRLVAHDGDDYKISMRVMKKKILTVILDTDYDVHYQPLGPARFRSHAYSTRISEVENAGRRDERHLEPGNDHGFLWRLYSYWRFEQRDGGVYVECEAISLTRPIPSGLGWLIDPIVKSLPRESLENTLRQTRAALRNGGR